MHIIQISAHNISFKRMSRCFSLSALCKWSVSVPDVTCAASESSCQDGTCIPISSWCNQVIDCADASDEKNCSKAALPMLQSSTRYLYPTIIIIILTYQIIIDYKYSAFLDLTKFSHHLVALISFKTSMTFFPQWNRKGTFLDSVLVPRISCLLFPI